MERGEKRKLKRATKKIKNRRLRKNSGSERNKRTQKIKKETLKEKEEKK